jgi:hypothetical protein
LDRHVFFDCCYGLMLADAVGKRFYALFLERARVYFEKRHLQELDMDVMDATGVDSSYGILNVIESAIDDAVTAMVAAPGDREVEGLLRDDYAKLFEQVTDAFSGATAHVLFREHNHLLMMPNEQDPPDVDTADETYPLARLRPIAELAGIYAVSMWKKLTKIRNRQRLHDYGRSHTKMMWYSITAEYRWAILQVLFPTFKTQRGDRILLDLPKDKSSRALDVFMYSIFKEKRNPILALVRPKLPPGVADVPRSDDQGHYWDSSGDEEGD